MPSNVENILNAILTGDGSGIQKPASRVEELLFEIYEQGGGGGGDSVIGGIKLTIDSDYVMTATLVDKDGEEYGVSDDIDLPLEEMVVDAEYDSQTQKIKLELKNGNYVEFSVAELVSGLQTELSSDNKLNPAYIAYDASHRAVSDTEKNTWNAKQNAISDLETIRSGAADGATAVQPSTMETALNGKQDTISDLAAIRSGASAGATAVQPATMTEALAAKQNSLSEAQLAAVNSGINSTKVTQIETNKTNILYAINTGVKNILPVDSCNVSEATYLLRDYKMNVPAGDYIFYINVTSTTATGIQVITSIGADDGQHRTGVKTITLSTGTGVKFESMTVLAGTTCITLYVNNAANIPEIMLCPKQLWDTLDHTFQHGALPNYDLTRLESEDRASLAEVVDSGAKNFIKCFDTYSAGGVTQTSSNGVVSATWTAIGSSNVYCRINEDLTLKPGTYIITGMQESNVAYYLHLEANGSTVANVETTNAVEFTVTNASAVYRLFIGVKANTAARTSPVTIKPMLCTKAAFGVSQKFVPYKVPITGVMSVVDKEVACSSTLTTTGIKFTATEKAAYRITATAIYYNSIPMKLAIKHKIGSGSTQGTLCTAVHVENEDVSLTVSGIRLLDVGGEFEIFAQYASSANNRFYVLVEKLD